MTIQQVGDWPTDQVKMLVENGASLQPVTVSVNDKLIKLLQMKSPPSLEDEDFPDG